MCLSKVMMDMIFKNMIHLQDVSLTNHQLRIVEVIMETLLLPFVLILEWRTGAIIQRVAKKNEPQDHSKQFSKHSEDDKNLPSDN